MHIPTVHAHLYAYAHVSEVLLWRIETFTVKASALQLHCLFLMLDSSFSQDSHSRQHIQYWLYSYFIYFHTVQRKWDHCFCNRDSPISLFCFPLNYEYSIFPSSMSYSWLSPLYAAQLKQLRHHSSYAIPPFDPSLKYELLLSTWRPRNSTSPTSVLFSHGSLYRSRKRDNLFFSKETICSELWLNRLLQHHLPAITMV